MWFHLDGPALGLLVEKQIFGEALRRRMVDYVDPDHVRSFGQSSPLTKTPMRRLIELREVPRAIVLALG